MFSFFPNLLTYNLLAATIIRVVIGLVILGFFVAFFFTRRKQIIEKLHNKNYPLAGFFPIILGIQSLIVGGSLVAGFLTQIMAIVAAYTFINIAIVDNGQTKVFNQSNLFYFTMAIISLTLVLLGAGFFAVDLPL